MAKAQSVEGRVLFLLNLARAALRAGRKAMARLYLDRAYQTQWGFA